MAKKKILIAILTKATKDDRTVSMDPGIGRLVEMFEERFGRPLTNIVIAILVSGGVGLSLHIIFVYILLPIFIGIKDIADFIETPRKEKIAQLFFGILPLASFSIVTLWGYVFGSRFMKNLRDRALVIDRAAKQLEDWRQIILDNLDKSQNLLDEGKKQLEEAIKMRDKQKDILRDIHELHKEAKHKKDDGRNADYTI